MLYGERIMAGLLRGEIDVNWRQKYIYASANFSRRSMRKKFSGLIQQKSNSFRLNSKLWKTIPFYNSLSKQNIFFHTLQTRHFRINFHKTHALRYPQFTQLCLRIKISVAKATSRKNYIN